MTRTLTIGTLLGVLAGGMSACASAPAYPIASDTPAQASPPAPPPAAAPAPSPAAVTPSPAAVESQILPPASTPPVAAPTTQPTPQPYSPTRPSDAAPPARPPAEPVRYVATGKIVAAHKMFRDYKVLKGDHLDAIARDLQTTPAALVEANHLKNPNSLLPGQHLRAPIEKVYVVVSGDTLAAVASRFNLDVADLADLNAMSPYQRLHAGEQLALPDAFKDRGPVPAPPTRAPFHYTPYAQTPWARAAAANAGGTGQSALGQAPAEPEATLTEQQVADAGRGRFVWPVKGEIIAGFGVMGVGRRNDGVDIRAPEGTPVKAAADGEVVYAGDQVPGFGDLVLVKHTDGWVTAYAHLGKISVQMRQEVLQDQEIGEVGATGGVTEPQLHFEIRYAPSPIQKAKPIDPQLVLPK